MISFAVRRRILRSAPLRVGISARLVHSTPPQDPFPLPLSEKLAHLVNAPEEMDGMPIRPIPRHNEDERTLRARLVYQSRKRGTLECDLLLSTFASEHLQHMSVAEMREYDQVRLSLYG